MKNCNLEVRLEWIKSKFGWVNYILTETRPRSMRLSTKVYFCNVTNSDEGMELDFCLTEKMRQIRARIG